MSDTKEKNDRGLTEKQERFLVAYSEILDIYRAAKVAGIHRSNIMADLKRDTPFAKEFKALTNDIDDDPRLSKSGSVGRMLAMIDRMSGLIDPESDTYDKNADVVYITKAILDVQKELNKMIDGHLASQKKVIENQNLYINGTYDFTAKNKLPDAPKTKTIRIDAE